MEKGNNKKTKEKKKEIIKKPRKIPETKKKELAKLVELIIKSNTTMIASIENISSIQFQKIKRLLKDKAIIKVVKRTLMFRALEKAKPDKKDIQLLEKWLNKNFTVIFSELDPFELASILAENNFPAKAKAGQISPKDIVLEAGPTDLPAGPLISELGKLKIKAGIESGRIAIKEKSILAKKGDKITKNAAEILTKLEITPFFIGLEPLAVYDTKNNKIYEEIKIDKQGLIEKIKKASTEATNFAFNMVYLTKETTNLIIAKANQELNILLNIIK